MPDKTAAERMRRYRLRKKQQREMQTGPDLQTVTVPVTVTETVPSSRYISDSDNFQVRDSVVCWCCLTAETRPGQLCMVCMGHRAGSKQIALWALEPSCFHDYQKCLPEFCLRPHPVTVAA